MNVIGCAYRTCMSLKATGSVYPRSLNEALSCFPLVCYINVPSDRMTDTLVRTHVGKHLRVLHDSSLNCTLFPLSVSLVLLLCFSCSSSLSIPYLSVRLRWSTWSRRPTEQQGRYSWSPAALNYEQCVPLSVHLSVVAVMHALYVCTRLYVCLPVLCVRLNGFPMFEGPVWEAVPPRALRKQETPKDHQHTATVNIRSCSTSITNKQIRSFDCLICTYPSMEYKLNKKNNIE